MISRRRARSALLSAVSVLLLAAALPPGEAAVPAPVALDAACAGELVERLGDVRVLGCDPQGRGLAVLTLGDPRTARHVAVLVPGSDIDLATLADVAHPQRRPFGWAAALAAEGGAELAVVLWVGYRTPQGVGLDAASGRLARAGAEALARFVDDLRAADLRPGAHLTVLGHSYGAVVVALAAARLAADDLVLLGSPGARASSVAELDTTARVWAARTDDDWTARIPAVRIGDLGHGADPSAGDFGARTLPVGGTSGHDGYFRPGSAALSGLAAVCLAGTT